jgi:hypothetical protein
MGKIQSAGLHLISISVIYKSPSNLKVSDLGIYLQRI